MDQRARVERRIQRICLYLVLPPQPHPSYSSPIIEPFMSYVSILTSQNLCIYSPTETRARLACLLPLSFSLSLSAEMASEREISYSSRSYGVSDEEEDEEEEEEDEEEECRDREPLYGRCSSGLKPKCLSRVLDPRAKWVQEWNRVFLLVCATGLFVDPLFFYVLSINSTCMCLFVDGWFAITVTALRCMTDALHLWNMWLQLKMAKRTFHVASEEGSRLHDASASTVALRYLKAKKGFFFDLFVILPLPQVRVSPTIVTPITTIITIIITIIIDPIFFNAIMITEKRVAAINFDENFHYGFDFVH